MASPEDFSRAYDRAACGLLTLDGGGRVELANPVVAGLTGLDAAALVGRRFQDLFTVGSRLFMQTQWWPLLALQDSVAEVHLDLVGAGGTSTPTLVNARRRPDGRTDVALFVAADRRKYEHELLLARRRAEELVEAVKLREQQFRTLAENSPDAIVRFDLERRITYVSRPVDPFSGNPSQALQGSAVESLALQGPTASQLARGLDAALAGHESTVSFERGEPGAALALEARFVPERSPRGEVVSVLAVVRDQTLLKRQALEAQQRAVVAEQLIGIVSHDLRNPLNAISLGTQLLPSVEGTKRAATLQRIVNSAQRAIRLTAELLDFTQARLGGGLRVVPVQVDVHALVSESLEELRLAWPDRPIVHHRQGPALGRADPDRLAQVVTNLVSNALVYGARGASVEVTSTVSESALELRVHNQGAPIDPALIDHIFEPMRRGEDQVQRGSRSVGLGLYIVRAIALAHHGQATVTSSAEAGTTFMVRWPLQGR